MWQGARSLVSDTLNRVHATVESVAAIECTPPHPPREDTPEYTKTHHFLVNVKDSPCEICGVRKSTLGVPSANPLGASAIETHHYPIERSLADACDPLKVHVAFPEVYDQDTLMRFVDSVRNMKVLCDRHHRDGELGIHHLLAQDFAVLPFLRAGYQIAATAKDETAALAKDEQIEQIEADIAAKETA